MSENWWGPMGGDEDRDYYKTQAETLRARAEKAEAELATEKKLVSLGEQAFHNLEKKYLELEAERDRYKEALEWYAASWSGEPPWPRGCGSTVIDNDGGQIARKALG